MLLWRLLKQLPAAQIYDTQCYYPIIVVKNTHYAAITDLAWYEMLLGLKLTYLSHTC